MSKGKIKVLTCCLRPETHNRGILSVNSMLREAGMEVIYLGNASPEEIVKASIEEDVDVIGVSSLSGAHLRGGKVLAEMVKDQGLAQRVALVMGGVIPPQDIAKLKDMGFAGVYLSGATREEIVNGVREAVLSKRNKMSNKV